MLSFEDVPLSASAYGRELYAAGRRLVESQGLRLTEMVWDADEVLWDWAMDARRLAWKLPLAAVSGDIGHREFFRVKPGMFELLWGMHHASLERGDDPHLRIWTNGYPWRLWRLCEQIPGFMRLLGGLDESSLGLRAIKDHPRVFSRLDYVEAAHCLLDDAEARARLPERVRAAINAHLDERPHDSSLKLPELAAVIGKPGFAQARILLDDQQRNIERFIASGRVGVQVATHEPPPRVHRTVNIALRSLPRHFDRTSTGLARSVVLALERLLSGRVGTFAKAYSGEALSNYPFLDFSIDIPNEVLRRELLEPVKALRGRKKKL